MAEVIPVNQCWSIVDRYLRHGSNGTLLEYTEELKRVVESLSFYILRPENPEEVSAVFEDFMKLSFTEITNANKKLTNANKKIAELEKELDW